MPILMALQVPRIGLEVVLPSFPNLDLFQTFLGEKKFVKEGLLQSVILFAFSPFETQSSGWPLALYTDLEILI